MKNASLYATRQAAQAACENKRRYLDTLIAAGDLHPAQRASYLEGYATLEKLLETITDEEFNAILSR